MREAGCGKWYLRVEYCFQSPPALYTHTGTETLFKPWAKVGFAFGLYDHLKESGKRKMQAMEGWVWGNAQKRANHRQEKGRMRRLERKN